VKKLMLATATIFIATASQSHAQFKVQEPKPIENWTSLECATVQATEYEPKDPVYKIEVNLTLDGPDSNIKELYVAHTHISGKIAVRSEQYQNGRLWKMPGKDAWFWSGNRTNGSMIGEVWRGIDTHWYYTEEFSNDRGRVEYRMMSQCHVVQGEGETTEEYNAKDQAAQEQPEQPPTMNDAPDWVKSKSNSRTVYCATTGTMMTPKQARKHCG
jgi:hypothetical protein